MPTIWFPALMRDLTGGAARVEVGAATIREAIDGLDAAYPGARERLLVGGDLDPTISVVVDGRVSRLRLLQPLDPGSEIHFVPGISGGAPAADELRDRWESE